jgi:hypothetical protein
MPASPNAPPVGPVVLPVGPVVLPGSPVVLPGSPAAIPAGPNARPAGPDVLVPGPAALLDPMLKTLTGPSELLLVPVPLPLNVVLPYWLVVVEWRVIIVAENCIEPTPNGMVGVEKGLPGAPGPWCVFASAVPSAAKAIHIVAAVRVPVIITVRVHVRCRWMLCLPTMSPLCNNLCNEISEDAAQFLERLSTTIPAINCKDVVTTANCSPSVARNIEVDAQRPPHITRIDAVLDGLRGRASPEVAEHMVDQHRRPVCGPELLSDELAEFSQAHRPQPT